jgi:hypothetical protein
VEQNGRPRCESTQPHPHAQNIQWEKQSLQQMLLGKLDICMQKLKLDPYHLPCTSMNSKWIKDLNLRPETWKLV